MTTPGESDCAALVAGDPSLKPHLTTLGKRQARYFQVKQAIENDFGSVLSLARSYKEFGLQRRADGSVTYREWGPGLLAASVYGDFNNWNRDEFPCEKDAYGVWTAHIPADRAPADGTIIKIAVTTGNGEKTDRLPQFAFRTSQAPGNPTMDALMHTLGSYTFQHPRPPTPKSLRVYECHVGMGSEAPSVGSYTEFTRDVLPYIAAAGYNAVQIMAIQEHSYYASFGYQVTSFFAPASRSGSPDELKMLIDTAHSLGLVVFLDVMQSHASKNVFDGLNRWDGTDHHLFHGGDRGTHSGWDSRLFNYSHVETQRFLLSNALYWVEEYGFDGFRFDAVTSMLYLHHGIGVGFTGGYHEYFGETADVDAIAYLKLVNDMLHSLDVEVTTIAEDVSGMPSLARPVSEGGIGFDYRFAMAPADMWVKLLKELSDEDWDVGNICWTLTNRRHNEKCIAYAECHDQALVGDKTLAFWLMDSEMYEGMSVLCTPSLVVDRGIALHKLIRLLTCGLGGEGWLAFMGNEFGHPEWVDFPRLGNNWSNMFARRQWSLATCSHLRYQHMGRFDRLLMELEEKYNFLQSGNYVTLMDNGNKIVAFERGQLLFVANLSAGFVAERYGVPVTRAGKYKIVMHSDDVECGGYGRLETDVEALSVPYEAHGSTLKQHILTYLPPRTAVVYELVPE